jgi:hypothetical protein
MDAATIESGVRRWSAADPNAVQQKCRTASAVRHFQIDQQSNKN